MVSGVKHFCLKGHGALAVGLVETSETWRAMAGLGFGVACCYVWTSTWKCAFVYVSRVMEETGAYTVAVLDDLWTRLILRPWCAEKTEVNLWFDQGTHFRCNKVVCAAGHRWPQLLRKHFDVRFGPPAHMKKLMRPGLRDSQQYLAESVAAKNHLRDQRCR